MSKKKESWYSLAKKHTALLEKCYGLGGYYWVHNAHLSEISRLRKIITRLQEDNK